MYGIALRRLEQIGSRFTPNWRNRTLFIADNVLILRGMNSETVDCIATDPPFNELRRNRKEPTNERPN